MSCSGFRDQRYGQARARYTGKQSIPYIVVAVNCPLEVDDVFPTEIDNLYPAQVVQRGAGKPMLCGAAGHVDLVREGECVANVVTAKIHISTVSLADNVALRPKIK